MKNYCKLFSVNKLLNDFVLTYKIGMYGYFSKYMNFSWKFSLFYKVVNILVMLIKRI